MMLGAYLTVGAFYITVGLFDIDVEDRLNLWFEVTLTPAQIAQLVTGGVPAAGGVTKWNLACNNTRTDDARFNAATIGAARIRQIEETTPDIRWNLSGNHMMDSWRFLAPVSYYDEWFHSFESDVIGTNAVFDAEISLDLDVAQDINEHASILVGGNNVFNNVCKNSGQKATDVNNTGANNTLVLGNT